MGDFEDTPTGVQALPPEAPPRYVVEAIATAGGVARRRGRHVLEAPPPAGRPDRRRPLVVQRLAPDSPLPGADYLVVPNTFVSRDRHFLFEPRPDGWRIVVPKVDDGRSRWLLVDDGASNRVVLAPGDERQVAFALLIPNNADDLQLLVTPTPPAHTTLDPETGEFVIGGYPVAIGRETQKYRLLRRLYEAGAAGGPAAPWPELYEAYSRGTDRRVTAASLRRWLALRQAIADYRSAGGAAEARARVEALVAWLARDEPDLFTVLAPHLPAAGQAASRQDLATIDDAVAERLDACQAALKVAIGELRKLYAQEREQGPLQSIASDWAATVDLPPPWPPQTVRGVAYRLRPG